VPTCTSVTQKPGRWWNWCNLGQLPQAQAIVVVEIAKNQNRLFGGTENFLVTREFREIATDEQREQLLECLFAVSAADEAISGDEEAQIRQIASELGFPQPQYLEVRLRYSDKRTVLRRPIAEP
jgi:tellurite resistance protein